jgi:serine/threonine-protein kinase
VIHRDIKPENIMLHDGSALVADFGIALAVSSAGGSRMTETGMSLGTPHYMSPEQAMGEREITARSDIYALGAMTYEMLIGEPPFTGPTAQAIIAKVMTTEPASMMTQRKSVPAAVEGAVFTALAKLPADRFGSAAAFAAALQGQGGTGAVRSAAGAPAARGPLLLVVTGVAVVALLVASFLGWQAAHEIVAPVARYSLDLPDLRVNHQGFYGAAIALSHDGSRLAYVAEVTGTPSHLMVKERGETAPRPLPGTDGANGPFFSPDGNWIGYTSAGKLYKVAASGSSPPVPLADAAADALAAGAWLDDGRIIFTNPSTGLMTIPANGGAPTLIAEAPPQRSQGNPTALPRKDLILVTICSNNCGSMTLTTLNLKTMKRDTILTQAMGGVYLPDGILLVTRQDGSVVAGQFDLDKGRFVHPPVSVLSGVQLELGIVPEFTASADGTMIYLAANQAGSDASLARVDRSGAGRILDPAWHSRFSSLALSADGRRVAVSLLDGPTSSIWIKQLDAGPLTRLTFGGNLNYRPAWMPDGRSITFTSDAGGTGSYLLRMRADGSDKAERMLTADSSQIDEAEWSRDGHWLIYRAGTVGGLRDIYARRVDGDTARVTVSAGPSDEYMPAISPDSRWIAYVSIESGEEEVYVRPFPETTRARWQISSGGGSAPAWSHSGRELFYVSRTDSMISVAIPPGAEFEPGAHRTLFGAQDYAIQPFHRAYDVTPDDQAFIMFKRSLVPPSEANRLTVVVNWIGEIEAKVRQSR